MSSGVGGGFRPKAEVLGFGLSVLKVEECGRLENSRPFAGKVHSVPTSLRPKNRAPPADLFG